MTDKDNSLKTLHQQFLDTLKAKNRSISTILAYGKDVDQSIEFLAKQKVTTVDGVTPDLLAVFQKQLFREKYSAKSISRKTNSLKSFFLLGNFRRLTLLLGLTLLNLPYPH